MWRCAQGVPANITIVLASRMTVAVDAQDPDAIGVRHISLLPSREPLSSVVRFATPTGTATIPFAIFPLLE